MSIEDAKKIVFKVGTSTLTYDNGKPNLKKFEELVRILSDLKNEDRQVVLVSSGAISVGVDVMDLKTRPITVAGKQAVAAVGQCAMMYIYDKMFSEYHKVVAQVLMTKDAVDNEKSKMNVINTFSELLKMGAIPIVNENDTISTEEIVFGDNDTLSAVVAECVNADLLVIITDIDGVYDKNPNECSDAKLISVVNEITPDLLENAGGAGSNRGTGGMYTKLLAADIAKKAGVNTAIISGKDLHKIYDLLEGKAVGTIIKA